jgi:type I restriction enzyme R subunit
MDILSPLLPFSLFDHEAEVQIVERRRPHWSQAGTACFITWRTLDSMPKAVLERWYGDRAQWLRSHGINPDDPLWAWQLQQLGAQLAQEFLYTFWNRWHDELDASHGACVLRQPELAAIVAKSLHHFDGERYLLLDFIVMPNHVHVLGSFPDEAGMLAQCESWKHFMATQVNRRLGQRGRFWQQDAFDHLIRSEKQFEYLRRYIADNPKKAGLRSGEYVHYSRTLPAASRRA